MPHLPLRPRPHENGLVSPLTEAREQQHSFLAGEFRSALWDAANTLRGSAVDRTDWKGYILPLLFFKRISDVWDEESAEARLQTH